MDYFSHLISFIFLFLTLTHNGISQTSDQSDFSDQQLIAASIEIMNDAKTCAFITLDKTGRPRVRAMDPFVPDTNLIVWLGSNPHSRKIAQIKQDPRVSLYYLDKDTTGYVMIHGQAAIVDSEEEKLRRWKNEWTDFYPDYPADYILIKVTPEWMEIISPPRQILGDPKTWTPAIVKF